MLSVDYLTDNPFRLLGVGSAITQSELRFAANAADKALKVGLGPDSGLWKLFEPEQLSMCAEKVRTLGTSPIERTAYRMFWPFFYQHQATFNGTQTDFSYLNRAEMHSALYIPQINFVAHWIDFLTDPSAESAHSAIKSAERLLEHTQLANWLTELLVNDGEDAEQAPKIVRSALKIVLTQLIGGFTRQIVQWYESHNSADALPVIKMLYASNFDEQLVIRAFDGLVAYGDREAAKLEQIVESYDGWHGDPTPHVVAEVQELRDLALALQSHLPVVHLWLEVVKSRVHQVALSMRKSAIEHTNKSDDFEKTRQIFSQIEVLPLSDEFVQLLRDDRIQVDDLAKSSDIWQGIKPIEAAPALYTLYGCGFKIYGRTPFTERADWFYVTYYGVILFLPIFPIRRYLISDAPNRGWHFHRKAALTKREKYHLAISLLLMCLFIGSATVASLNPSTDYSNAANSTYSYATPPQVPPTFPPPTDNEKPTDSKNLSVNPLPTQPTITRNSAVPELPIANPINIERQRLEAEYDRIKAELAEENISLKAHRSTVKSATDRLLQESSSLDTTDEYAVSMYNARVDQSHNDRDVFNAEVNAYNEKVQQMNQIVEQIHAMRN